jgi:geranylgeranyl pyrophosphate synthase
VSDFDLESWLSQKKAEVDALLDAELPQLGDDPGRLVEAMRYSLLAPGKRLRPILALAAAEAVGARLDTAVRLASAAVELVHCYSLIHDDLPAMDDDDLRRGRPTSHKAFGEATAILAGDALLTLAFEWLARAGGRSEAPQRYLMAVAALARGAGASGMVRGQARDMSPTPPPTLEDIERLHVEKTGCLFRAALEVGATTGGASPAQTEALARFGIAYGIAFQHRDDADDDEHGDFAAVAAKRVHELIDEAITAVSGFGQAAAPLRALAQRLAQGLAQGLDRLEGSAKSHR